MASIHDKAASTIYMFEAGASEEEILEQLKKDHPDDYQEVLDAAIEIWATMQRNTATDSTT